MSETAWVFADAEFVNATVEYGHVVDEGYWKVMVDRYGSFEAEEPCEVLEITLNPEDCPWWKHTRAEAEEVLIEVLKKRITTDLRERDCYEVEFSAVDFKDDQEPTDEQLEQEYLTNMEVAL